MTEINGDLWKELKKDVAEHPWAVKFATWGVFLVALNALFGCIFIS